ncbi:pentapeptide repeat-containing protein [Mastigocoleus sp. MO_188.B34]|uniref:pentapeptide repeat-containing protein n=1 Tax=Mastigocoleus sp. MO_188.B34 TaxID=3036635 RepID=UPI00261B8DA2|nr:pentapeptide repeat-containing protein [Mastigocoleus sp. MO_188.B34]MDJ0698102.1 pentapeptide repeat-containing protein [Mastigocoleus sp. MO_188.B34]
MFQDFSGQNLRGCSFRGQNLEGADFSNTDLRGANFTGANLHEANFTGAKGGLPLGWAICLVMISWLVSGLSGLLFAYNGFLVSLIFSSNVQNQFLGWTTLIVTVIIFAIILRQGITAVALAGAGAFAVAGTVAFTVAFTVAGAFAIAVALAFAEDEALALALAGSVAVVGAVISSYIAWRGMKGDKKYALIRNAAFGFAAIGGTSFRSADLTDANFTSAQLKSTDLRKATLTRTCFHKTKLLDRVRPGTSYLKYPYIRQLLTTGRGQDKNFDHLDLRGINLKGTLLTDANFIGTDLSEACLQDADLSRAKLVQTQLDGTDFTGATLTGAYIEDWNITNETNFRGVRCEYVYMQLPSKENPDPWRKPDNREEVFADGEFGDFIKPLVDTLDLYHNQGVDPRAIAISFKELAENNPNAQLQIVGMEIKGEDNFLLRAKTAQEADKSQLSAEYFETYNCLKGLPSEEQIKHFLTELKFKDNQINYQENHISRLETMISTALERPSLQAENIYSRGGIMSQSSKKESHFDLKGAQFAGGLVDTDTVNAEQIGGDTTNYDQEQKQKETNNSAVKTILILASNPKDTSRLRLDEEVREIDAGLQRASKRELFDLKQRWAVRIQDVYQALLDFKPQIVHFSGHGSGDDGLALEDEAGNLQLVDTEALTKLFELFSSRIECVVLNACYSEVQAQAIAKYIPYVIGMNQAIGDKAAVKFSTGFYNALGAGESVEFAYKLGCSIIQLEGIAENFTPVLKKK